MRGVIRKRVDMEPNDISLKIVDPFSILGRGCCMCDYVVC